MRLPCIINIKTLIMCTHWFFKTFTITSSSQYVVVLIVCYLCGQSKNFPPKKKKKENSETAWHILNFVCSYVTSLFNIFTYISHTVHFWLRRSLSICVFIIVISFVFCENCLKMLYVIRYTMYNCYAIKVSFA